MNEQDKNDCNNDMMYEHHAWLESIKQKPFDIGEYCHHRGEHHELRITYDGKCRRCIHCGLYFEL